MQGRAPSLTHKNHAVGTEPAQGALPSTAPVRSSCQPSLPRPGMLRAAPRSSQGGRIPLLSTDTEGQLEPTPQPGPFLPPASPFSKVRAIPVPNPPFISSGPAQRDFRGNGNKDMNAKLELVFSRALPHFRAVPQIPQIPWSFQKCPSRKDSCTCPGGLSLWVPLTAQLTPNTPRGPAGKRWGTLGNQELRESRNKAEIPVRNEPWAAQGRVRAKEESREGDLTHSQSLGEALSPSWSQQREGKPRSQGSAQPELGFRQTGRETRLGLQRGRFPGKRREKSGHNPWEMTGKCPVSHSPGSPTAGPQNQEFFHRKRAGLRFSKLKSQAIHSSGIQTLFREVLQALQPSEGSGLAQDSPQPCHRSWE